MLLGLLRVLRKKKKKPQGGKRGFYFLRCGKVFNLCCYNSVNMGLTPSSPGQILIKLGSACLVIVLNLLS